MMFQKSYKNKGMMLVDVIVAFSLAVIFTVIMTQSLGEARSLFEYSYEKNFLLNILENNIEQFRELLPGENKDIDLTIEGQIVQLHGEAHWYGNERIEIVITINNKLTIETIYAYPLENQKMISMPLCLVDIGFSQELNKNISIKPIILPIDPLLPLTDIRVSNNSAYISADSSRINDPDILVFNIASSTNVELLSSLNTGPGISSFVFVKDKIYAAANSTASQIHIIDVTNSGLSLLGRQTLSLSSTSTPPSSGSSITYYNNRIFLGTTKWEGVEFNIFKIENNSLLSFKSSFEVGSKINSIFIFNDLAYVAASAMYQLLLIDIRDELHPTLLDTFEPTGWSRQEGKVVSYFEDMLNFGRTAGGFDIRGDHEFFQKVASTSPDDLDFIDSYNIAGGVYGIIKNRSQTLMLTREAGKELQLFTEPIRRGPIKTYSLPIAGQRLVCDRHLLYVLAASAPYIYEVSFK